MRKTTISKKSQQLDVTATASHMEPVVHPSLSVNNQRDNEGNMPIQSTHFAIRVTMAGIPNRMFAGILVEVAGSGCVLIDGDVQVISSSQGQIASKKL